MPIHTIYVVYLCQIFRCKTVFIQQTKERALLLYEIKKGLNINVRHWVSSNIRHTIRQGSRGIPHPTLLTELIVSQGIDTTGQEIL